MKKNLGIVEILFLIKKLKVVENLILLLLNKLYKNKIRNSNKNILFRILRIYRIYRSIIFIII